MSARNVRLTVGVLVVAAVFLVAVVFLAEGPTAIGAPGTAALSSSGATVIKPPRLLIARKLKARPQLRPVGSLVRQSELSLSRVFSVSDDGFKPTGLHSATYPAPMSDGRVWKIDGPQSTSIPKT